MPTNNAIPMTVVENAHAVEMPAVSEAVIQAVSPTVELEQIEGGVRMTVHDVRGDHTGILEDGPQGERGVTPDIHIGTVETLPAGSSATASITGAPALPLLNLGIPTGATGETPEISIGEVETLEPDEQAYAELDESSTPDAPVINFGIPRGETSIPEDLYGSTIPMSASDSTKVADAIGGKLDANQGSANAGKLMRVLPDGELAPGNIYGNTTEMSASDSTTVADAIGAKLNANQGSGNAGKFMRVGSTGGVAYDDPTERYTSVSNFPAAGDAGKLYIAEDTGKIYIWDGTGSEYVLVGGTGQGIFYGTSSTGANVTPKKVTISPDFYAPSDIPDGTIICVRFTKENNLTYSVALNINNQGSGGGAPGIGIYTPDGRGGSGTYSSEFLWIAGEIVVFIYAYGAWRIIRPGDMKGATSSAAGLKGLVPAPAAGDQGKFLKGDGTWAMPPGTTVMTGATASAAGTSGLVPAPAAGSQNKLLRGDGTWADLCLTGSLTAISASGTISDIALPGLTAAHRVINWGLFSDSGATTPISPTEAPADITITEKANAYDITVANFDSAFYIRPTFILPQNN